MEQLQRQLDDLMHRLTKSEDLRANLDSLLSIYPFNEFEYILVHLFSEDKLSLDEYYDIRNSYIDRNLYLYLFEIRAPRGFGEAWAQGNLKQMVPSLIRPNKKEDPDFSGQYDFILPPDIRIEVKASRAVEYNVDAPLYMKAPSSDSTKPFDMNFQQIKPRCCDVFVWIAVWRDAMKYWVIPSYEVETNPYYSSGQHRGNVGEGQLHLKQNNIREFDRYLVEPLHLEYAIRQACERERVARS